jgi:hypothetical protein
VVIAGLRSYPDHTFLKSHFTNYAVVFIHSPALVRYERLRKDKSVTVKTDEAFQALDRHHEMEGIALVAEDSDFVLVDDNSFPVPIQAQLINFVSRKLLH